MGVSSSSVASRTTAARAAVDIGASERSIERYISWTDEGVDLFVCEADKVSLHAHVFPVRQVLIRPTVRRICVCFGDSSSVLYHHQHAFDPRYVKYYVLTCCRIIHVRFPGGYSGFSHEIELISTSQRG